MNHYLFGDQEVHKAMDVITSKTKKICDCDNPKPYAFKEVMTQSAKSDEYPSDNFDVMCVRCNNCGKVHFYDIGYIFNEL